MIPIGNHFGYVGGVSWLVILLTIVFLFFILITVCAKKDSWVRAIAYTACLTVLMVYMVWWHLVPEIQKFHNLVPGDCLIAGPPVLVNYTYPHGHMVVVAHIPVNVSNIECHGEVGHGMDMTDIQGMKHFDARHDVIFCKEGESLANESTAYLKIDNWRWLGLLCAPCLFLTSTTVPCRTPCTSLVHVFLRSLQRMEQRTRAGRGETWSERES